MKNKTFIYMLRDPRDNSIRYIGKANDLKSRLHNHCNPARHRNTHKFNWIKSLRKLGLKPIMEVIEEVNMDDWKSRERYWINYYRESGVQVGESL